MRRNDITTGGEQMKKPLIIGISGKSGVGKTTLGSRIQGHFGGEDHARHIAFADSLKRLAYEITGLDFSANDVKNKHRGFLQDLGFAMRSLDADTFITSEKYGIHSYVDEAEELGIKIVVISDVRFPNEVDYIHSLGGKVISLGKVGQKTDGQHESETALDDYLKFDYWCYFTMYPTGEHFTRLIAQIGYWMDGGCRDVRMEPFWVCGCDFTADKLISDEKARLKEAKDEGGESERKEEPEPTDHDQLADRCKWLLEILDEAKRVLDNQKCIYTTEVVMKEIKKQAGMLPIDEVRVITEPYTEPVVLEPCRPSIEQTCAYGCPSVVGPTYWQNKVKDGS